jgi:sulfite reductase (ferredoxin)
MDTTDRLRLLLSKDYKLDPAVDEVEPDGGFRDHVGIHPQKQPGLRYAGFSVSQGRLTPAKLRAVADLAQRYGNGSIRLTPMQNLLVLNIPESAVAAFTANAAGTGLPLAASPFFRGTVSCTGTLFCKLAIVETKAFSDNLAAELARRFPDFHDQVKIHVTGCTNSCGQHAIAEIGMQGVTVKVNGETVDGFDFCLGGHLGAGAAKPVIIEAAALTRAALHIHAVMGLGQGPDAHGRQADAIVKGALLFGDANIHRTSSLSRTLLCGLTVKTRGR